eukprot:124814_1
MCDPSMWLSMSTKLPFIVLLVIRFALSQSQIKFVSKTTIGEIDVALTMYRDTQRVEVEMYGPIGRWFGVLFGDSHSNGDSFIYTTGYGGADRAGSALIIFMKKKRKKKKHSSSDSPDSDDDDTSFTITQCGNSAFTWFSTENGESGVIGPGFMLIAILVTLASCMACAYVLYYHKKKKMKKDLKMIVVDESNDEQESEEGGEGDEDEEIEIEVEVALTTCR